MILYVSELYYVLVGAGGECNEREEASADHSGVLPRQQSPFGGSHSHVILEKSTSAGPQLGCRRIECRHVATPSCCEQPRRQSAHSLFMSLL